MNGMTVLALAAWLFSACCAFVFAVLTVRWLCRCVCCKRSSLVRWKFAGERYCPECARFILEDAFAERRARGGLVRLPPPYSKGRKWFW